MAKPTRQLAWCVNNEGYPVSLERNKLYRVLPDKDAEVLKMVRVVDESGEDYLFPAECFEILDRAKLKYVLQPKALRRVRKSLQPA
jgi:hypothetical protein